MKSETYYRSLKKRIEQEKQTALGRDPKNIRTSVNGVVKKPGKQSQSFDFQSFNIPKLSKHLKKNAIRNCDRRFLIILCLSFVFHLLFLYIAYQNTSFEVSSDDISRIQHNFANLILDKEAIISGQEGIEDDAAARVSITPAKERDGESGTESILEEEQAIQDRTARRKRRREDRAKDTESAPEIDLSDKGAGGTSGKRGALIAKVSNMGVLEYMRSTVITSDIDDNFLVYTNAINKNLLRMLDGIDGEDMAAARAARKADAARNKRSAKDKETLNFNRSSGNAKVKDLFGRDTPLEEARQISIDKIEHYEKIPQSLNGLSRRRKRKVKRTAAEISAVIRIHNKAIQDCYKQALRKEVELKGKIVIQFSISPAGRVTSVTIISSNLKNERMERCIITKMRRWNDFGICETQTEDITLKQSYVFGY